MAEEGVTAGGQEAVSVGSQEDVTPGGQKREEWSSRWAFYFAGVGAAVGFGKFGDRYDEKHQRCDYQKHSH
jgi:hypothetical protein